MNSPFLLENQAEYEAWKKIKLSSYPKSLSDLCVKIDQNNFGQTQIDDLKKILSKYNFVLYKFDSKIDDLVLQQFCKKLNLVESISNPLSDINNISNITDNSNKTREKIKGEYIPYTNKKLNWHTDGYYYPTNFSVKSFLLHCENQAESGGKNHLIDHEIIYIFLRDHNPEFIDILMQKDIMEIPKNKNISSSKSIKGPVFYIDKENYLNMRYTSRKQNIVWKKDDMIKKIKIFLDNFLNDNEEYIFSLLLENNQGYLANNVLHRREEYIDGEKKRLLKRIRFLNRIN